MPYFGRKDAQQLAVIRRMTADLNLPVDVVGCPLVREARRPRDVEPQRVPVARRSRARDRALVGVADRGRHRRRRPARCRPPARDRPSTPSRATPGVRVDYVEVVDAVTLQPLVTVDRDALVAVAAFVGTTRLIDNVGISFDGDSIAVDTGVVSPSFADPSAHDVLRRLDAVS